MTPTIWQTFLQIKEKLLMRIWRKTKTCCSLVYHHSWPRWKEKPLPRPRRTDITAFTNSPSDPLPVLLKEKRLIPDRTKTDCSPLPVAENALNSLASNMNTRWTKWASSFQTRRPLRRDAGAALLDPVLTLTARISAGRTGPSASWRNATGRGDLTT